MPQHFLWMFILMVTAAIAESWAGSVGWVMPTLAITSFYVMSVFGWRRPLVLGIIVGTLADVGFGRTFPVTAVLVLPAVAALSALWHRSGNFHQLRLQVLPGVGCALLQGILILTTESLLIENRFGRLWLHDFMLLLTLAAEGALLLPLLCSLLDGIANLLGLPRFVTLRPAMPTRFFFHAH